MMYLLAIVGLAVLIVVHEAGHMLVARLMGMRVEQFSVGFGPSLLRWRGPVTTYQIALIPLGGYVKIAGMNPQDQLPEDDPGSYANKAPWRRFLVILAGPLTNYLFAVIIMVGVYASWGLPQPKEVVGGIRSVLTGSPAFKAGLKPGDRILTISGARVQSNDQARKLIMASKGAALPLVVSRAGAKLPLKVTPEMKGKRYLIGIGFDYELSFIPLTAGQSLLAAVLFPVEKSLMALGNLGRLFSGQVGVDQMGGPVAIVRQLKLSFDSGLLTALTFMALLNVLLGVFNLLPLPALDGGRLIFLGFTLVTRRQVNQRIENAVHMVGFIILLGLLLLLTFGDTAKLIKESGKKEQTIDTSP